MQEAQYQPVLLLLLQAHAAAAASCKLAASHNKVLSFQCHCGFWSGKLQHTCLPWPEPEALPGGSARSRDGLALDGDTDGQVPEQCTHGAQFRELAPDHSLVTRLACQGLPTLSILHDTDGPAL